MRTESRDYAAALDEAERLLGFRLERFLGTAPTEPANADDFKRIATIQAFGDASPRTDELDTRTRAIVSVTIAATLGVLEPLRGQLRIALNNGVTKEIRRGVHPVGGVRRCGARVRGIRCGGGGVRGE